LIEIKIDFDLKYRTKDQISVIPRYKSGVYVLYDSKKDPLYVGVACDLRGRISQHFSGTTHTYRYSHHFKFVSVVLESDEDIQEVCEQYLIRKLSPPLNRTKKYKQKPIPKRMVNKSDDPQCKGQKVNGERCSLPAHENGYCHYHGGNGITKTKIMQEAASKAGASYMGID